MGLFSDLQESGDAFARLLRGDVELRSYVPSEPIVIGLIGDEEGGSSGIGIRLDAAGIEVVPSAHAEVGMRAREASWDACLARRPEPWFSHFLAMRMRVPGTEILGDEVRFAQHAHIARRIVELARVHVSGEPDPGREPVIDRSGIVGGYVGVDYGGKTVDLYVETAGDAALPPLVVLHTAGADSRQAHPMMSDPEVLRRYRVLAFDLPGHGRSGRIDHPFGGWSLTTDLYTEIIAAAISALRLERPLLLGASMAGEVCLAMAIRFARLLGGVVACEAADHVPGRTTEWPRDPRVNAMAFTPEWIDGLIGPDAPAMQREEIRWQYSQGGFGIFRGDIDFYSGDWDGRSEVGSIDTRVCPVVMMTGEYDYSCTPEMSEATAARIPGATYWTMPGLGHFPTCEHPAAFAPHLLRALDLIERNRDV